MPLQTFEDGRRQVFFAAMVLFQDSIEQQRDVFQTMTQGRYRQLERRQTIIQIHAEAPFLHQVEKGLVRCADDPHIDRIHAIAADAQDLSCFEHPQQTQLGLLTDVTDLVQEQRPLVGHLEKAGLAAAFGPRKGPLLIAEQLTFYELARHRRNIHGHERPVLAPAAGMQGMGGQLFSGARLPLDEDVHV